MAIQSVKRALDILSFFSASNPQMGITDISRQMQLPKPTVHGLVQTLVKEGFLSQDAETRKYTLGLKIYELGTYLLGTLKINQVGIDPAQRLSRKTTLKSRIGLLEQGTILVTATLAPDTDSQRYNLIGPRLPAYCTAVGKAILSGFTDSELEQYLDQTPLQAYTQHTITRPEKLIKEIRQARQNGYVLDREEYLLNVFCIGVPILNNQGKIFASLSISGRPEDFSDKKMAPLIQELKHTGMEISGRMGFLPDPLRI